MYTVESKSLLAKLMAMENITIEHRNTKTASFNPKTRTLVCPNWEDASAHLYDLLMGHEISHALNTPTAGWHDAIVYSGKNKKATEREKTSYHHFLNVAEDARIEKLVKRTYPGLRRSMILGYKELLKRDFFGLSTVTNLNDLYLIDKLNLAAKLGTQVNIHFTAEELPFFTELMATETFAQVVDLTNRLYEYSKHEQKDGEKKKKELSDYLKDSYRAEEEEEEGQEGESYPGFDEDDEEEGGEEGDGKGEDASEDEEDQADDATTVKQQDQGQGRRGKKQENDAKKKGPVSDGAGGTVQSDFVPESKTDQAYRNMEQTLVKDDSRPTHYINIPTPKLADLVVPAARVNSLLNEHFSTIRPMGLNLLSEFKKKNEDYISLLAKEFEMKKAARSYAKAKISDSGDIDLNKLATYKMEDNMFRKMMTVHKGKSHGLVLLLDKSGSMHEHIVGAMEQIIVMAYFCRKVNIPFVAYTYTSSHGHEVDFAGRPVDYHHAPFSIELNDLRMGDLTLREMFNSRMSANDFTMAIINHLTLAVGLANKFNSGVQTPLHEGMGSTPLNEALVPVRDMIRTFKKQHRLDLVNLIIVHDGDSDGNQDIWGEEMRNWSHNQAGLPALREKHNFNVQNSHVTLVDKKEHVSVKLPMDPRGVTVGLMRWIQLTTGCGIFGFYITDTSVKGARREVGKLYENEMGIKMRVGVRYSSESVDQTIALNSLCVKLLADKFLESFTEGYNRLYFIPGSSQLKVETAGMSSVEGIKWTPSRLLTAFKKVNKRKQVSRVLVSKFIQMIAE